MKSRKLWRAYLTVLFAVLTGSTSAQDMFPPPWPNSAAEKRETSVKPKKASPALPKAAALPTSMRTPEQRLGGSFTLTNHLGQQFVSSQLNGRPYIILFGFTHCPDVCPTSLLVLSNHLAELKNRANGLRVIFVSIDPERDTADDLKAYLSSFDPRIIGLTGSEIDVAAVAQAYQISYEKVPTSSSYTMNHTASIFLYDRRGRLMDTLRHDEKEKEGLSKINRLLNTR